MQLYEINDIKKLTTELFVNNTFNHFSFIEGTCSTYANFSISGKVNTDYYDGDSDASFFEYAIWEQMKPVFFQIIKGKRLPLQFKITLALSDDSDVVKTRLINIRYEAGKLSIVTGISYKTFSMDKSHEKLWDDYISSFLVQNDISFTIC